ncbi:Dual specificity protein phosphatase 1 [Diplonema papillatum]|nr:Dual specificity protein phosphatase 1 [Diplonema papillatum]
MTPGSKPRERGRRKGPPLAPLSTLSEAHVPVHRLTEEEQLELAKHDSRSETLSQITPWLFLGSHSDAMDKNLLRKHNIKCVLNTAKECDSSSSDSSGGESPDRSDVEYQKLELADHADESISLHFFTAFNFLETWRKQNRNVLVHCRRGISRSATLVIAYLMQHQSKQLQEAYNHVRSRRSIISPNLGFVLSLEAFAQELGNSRQQAHEALQMFDDDHQRKLTPCAYNQPIAC